MNFYNIEDYFQPAENSSNKLPPVDFDGYSPLEMHHILYSTFSAGSPIALQGLSDSEYERVPLLHQVQNLMHIVEAAGELKLTKNGYLPQKIVRELYDQGILKDDLIERGITKLVKEIDTDTIHLPRILAELMGVVKKRKGKLSLTQKGKKLITHNQRLMEILFRTFTETFNWAYSDGYGDNYIGQFGYGFTLLLLSKYGDTKRPGSFYAQKYFAAFPHLLDFPTPVFSSPEEYAERCYLLRTFERFLAYFGIVHFTYEGAGLDRCMYVSKSDLFDTLLECKPPQNKV
ncbi:MAG: hypothetical protein ACQEQV_02130 [Fibrobacterota bacterium]